MLARKWVLRLLVTAVAILGMVATVPAWAQASVAQGGVPSAVPSKATPSVNDGTVFTIAQSGSSVFLGGSFTNATSPGAASAVSRPNILAFDAATGAISSTFVPDVDGEVDSIIAGPSNTIYIAGAFKTVDGVKMRVARLDATTGALVSGWKPQAFSAATTTLALSGGILYVGGTFAKVGGVAHGGLVALDPTTGKTQSWFSINTAGHHGKGTAKGGVGPKTIKVDPTGRIMVVIGNFTSVTDGSGTYARDQIFRVNLGTGTASVDPNWRTLKYTAQCYNWAFDSYIRDVDFAPDGSYFVVVGTGGGGGGGNVDGSRSLCDAMARFETSSSGQTVAPTWVSYAGGDSLWSVAVTGSAIYAGGHQRWANNANGNDSAGAGAVPRPGLMAIDPQNGVPLSWNPGRNPRGAGAFALLATSDGLYVGSDTEWIGNYQYRRPRIAYFPLAGGSSLPANTIGTLPGTVYFTSGNSLASRTMSASGAVGGTQSVDSSMPWSQVRGAFMVDNTIFYGLADGTFDKRTFNGTTLGAQTAVDPYNDPAWSTVPTGSGSSVYRGTVPDLYGTKMSKVTSMFYTGGNIYYTLSGSASMYWRPFTPESGIMGPVANTVSDGQNWSNVAGSFVTGNTLYYATTDGVLHKIAWAGDHATGSSSVADSSNNWATQGMFLMSAQGNKAPTASLSATCDHLDCTFNASGSTDSDGSIVGYSWSFGDGTNAQGTSATASHTYAGAGSVTASVTVTDNGGATDTASTTVNPTSVPTPSTIAFDGQSSGIAQGTAPVNVSVPASAKVGDTLVLASSFSVASATTPNPTGWALLKTQKLASGMVTRVWTKSATSADIGSPLSLTYSASGKATAVVAAYSGAAAPTAASVTTRTDTGTATHTAPAVTVTDANSWVLSYWTDRSNPAATSWTAPGDVTVRGTAIGKGKPSLSTLLADSGGAVGAGTYAGRSATAAGNGLAGVSAAIVLTPISQ